MKYVIDENLTVKDEDLPDNVINARDLYFMNGFREHGIEDQKLLTLATKEGYTIITKDRKLVIKANQQNVDIVYARGRFGKKWFFIPKELRVTNNAKLRQFVEPEIYDNKHNDVVIVKDMKVIPFYMKKGSNKINKTIEGSEPKFIAGTNKLDLSEPKFYEGTRLR